MQKTRKKKQEEKHVSAKACVIQFVLVDFVFSLMVFVGIQKFQAESI